MDKIGQALLWLGLLLVAVLGIWLFLAARDAGAPPNLDNLNPLQALAPQPTPTIYASSAAVLQGVQSLSRLETVSYRIEKVITAETGQGPLGFLFGDKLLLIAHAEITAGIDLSNIDSDDIVTTADGAVYIKLPDVEIFHAYLDNSRTTVYDRRTGVAGLNVDLESAARLEAENLILQTALELGIEEEADENAREVLRSFIQSMGFRYVVFVDDALPTPTPLPPTATPAPAGP